MKTINPTNLQLTTVVMPQLISIQDVIKCHDLSHD